MPPNEPRSARSKPPKRRAHRSSSTSSLFSASVFSSASAAERLPDVSCAAAVSSLAAVSGHSRRNLSRAPRLNPSQSSHSLFPAPFSSLPSTPEFVLPRSPSLPRHLRLLSLSRLGAAVDALLRPPAKGKPRRPCDLPALLALFSIFLAIFLSLILLLRLLYPQPQPHSHLQRNLDRVRLNLPPHQFWPSIQARQRALRPTPPPLYANVSAARIWQTRYLANRRVPQKLRLSVVAACKDRTAYLQTALPAWLDLLHPLTDEVILVDWATDVPEFVPLLEVVRASADPRLSVVTLSHRTPWALSRAYNLAFSLARGQWLLKLDCDTILKPNFLSAHPLPPASDVFYRFNWRHAQNLNQQHLNGVFLARTAHIRAVHGYDERITTYGWEDTNLYHRLQHGRQNLLPPIRALPIQPDTLYHIHHNDTLRGADQHLDLGPLLQTQVNSQASETAPSWTDVGASLQTVFSLSIHSRDARFLSATILTSPRSLLDDVDQNERTEILQEASSRILHDVFGLPWVAFAELDRPRPHLVRALTAASSRPARPDGATGAVFVIVAGGVAERLVGVASALAFASSHKRVLFLTWGDGCVAGQIDVPACKTSDFIDLGADNQDDEPVVFDGNESTKFGLLSMDESPNQIPQLPVFQLSRWRCKGTVEECSHLDKAYDTMAEWRPFNKRPGPADVDAGWKVESVLRGKVNGKRNVVLRLHGAFPIHTDAQVMESIRSTRVSKAVQAYVREVGDVSGHVGVFLGASVRMKGLEGMAKRLQGEDTERKFFVTGVSREIVESMRKIVRAGTEVEEGLRRADVSSVMEGAQETMRQLGELVLLSRCRHVVNDGRPSDSVLTVLQALRERGNRE